MLSTDLEEIYYPYLYSYTSHKDPFSHVNFRKFRLNNKFNQFDLKIFFSFHQKCFKFYYVVKLNFNNINECLSIRSYRKIYTDPTMFEKFLFRNFRRGLNISSIYFGRIKARYIAGLLSFVASINVCEVNGLFISTSSPVSSVVTFQYRSARFRVANILLIILFGYNGATLYTYGFVSCVADWIGIFNGFQFVRELSECWAAVKSFAKFLPNSRYILAIFKVSNSNVTICFNSP